jgi:hypothetical protein
MENKLCFKVISVISLVSMILSYLTCSFSESAVVLKSVKRSFSKNYVFNEYEELIGDRYNRKFYADEEDGVVLFTVDIENEGLIPYSFHLFIKTNTDQKVRERVIEVGKPEKKSQVLKIILEKQSGVPDIWWGELRDISGKIIYDEQGVPDFKEIKKKIELINNKST